MNIRSGRSGVVGSVIVAAVIFFCSINVLVTALIGIHFGGSEWKQGDWLINSLNEPVRRGLTGSLFIHLADASGMSPLWVVAIVQIALFCLLMALTFIIFRQFSDRLNYLLLLISPGFFLVFWAADTQASLRKELFGYCAIALVATYPVWRSRVAPVLAGSLFAAGCIAHEANIFLFPALVAIVVMSGCWVEDRKVAIVGVALALAGVIFALGYTLAYSRVADTGAVCAPLLTRGLLPAFCDGAIAWVGRTLQDGVRKTMENIARPGFGVSFALAAIAAYGPLIYYAGLLNRPRVALGICFFASLPLLPLYILAIDWGRWLNMQVTSIVFMLYVLALRKTLVPLNQPGALALMAVLFCSVMLTPDHENGLRKYGLVLETMKILLYITGPIPNA